MRLEPPATGRATFGLSTNGLGLYRFSYNGSTKAYVGVLAQDVQQVVPQAVTRGNDGYLRVDYEKIGVKFQSYEQWIRGPHAPPQDPMHDPGFTRSAVRE
jgi:hypothetical protein